MYIAFDLDDTLLNSKKEISKFTLEVLASMQVQGHKLIINTARNYALTEEIIDLINPDFSILNGGSIVLDKKRNLVFADVIPTDVVERLISDLRRISSRISVEALDGSYSSSKLYVGDSSRYFDFFNDVFRKPCFKVLAFTKKEIEAKEIAIKHNLNLNTYLDGAWRSFISAESSKWKALKIAIEHDGGNIDDVVAFGDDIGDLDMLKQAKIGVAMDNSTKIVLEEIENRTLSNDEDGVARYLVDVLKL